MSNEEHARHLESDMPAEITEEATMLDVRSWCYKSGYRDAIEDLRAGRIEGMSLCEVERCEVEPVLGTPGIPVFVNARRHSIVGQLLSYEELFQIAFPDREVIPATATFRGGPPHKQTGRIISGQSVELRSGMIFNVSVTDNA